MKGKKSNYCSFDCFRLRFSFSCLFNIIHSPLGILKLIYVRLMCVREGEKKREKFCCVSTFQLQLTALGVRRACELIEWHKALNFKPSCIAAASWDERSQAKVSLNCVQDVDGHGLDCKPSLHSCWWLMKRHVKVIKIDSVKKRNIKNDQKTNFGRLESYTYKTSHPNPPLGTNLKSCHNKFEKWHKPVAWQSSVCVGDLANASKMWDMFEPIFSIY